MYLVKEIYGFVLLFISVSMIFSFILSNTTKSKVSVALLFIHVSSFISIFSFFSTIYIRNEKLVYILYGLYFFMLDVAVFLIMRLLTVLDDDNRYVNAKHFGHICYISFMVLDGILLMTDIFTKKCFVLTPIYIDHNSVRTLLCWSSHFDTWFFYHIYFCYISSVLIIYKFLRRTFSRPPIYRPKFLMIISLFFIVLVLNYLYQFYFHSWYFDYSLIFYGLAVFFSSYASLYSLPKKIQKNIIFKASENISDAIVCLDYEDHVVYENEKGHSIVSLFAADENAKKEWMQKFLDLPVDFVTSTETVINDEGERVFNVEFRRLRDKKGRYTGAYIKMNECTSEVMLMRREQYRATHDALTGLLNRSAFFKETERILHEKPDVPRYLVCTNIRNFKIVNDLFGEKFGDEVLKRQAEMLNLADYPDCIKARVSGDRFGMLINKEDFKPELAKKNTERLEELTKSVNYDFKIFIGVYEIADPYENVRTMFDKASIAMIDAENELNTAIFFYNSSVMKKLFYEKNIISEFKFALMSNMFNIFLQPQIRSCDGKCIGAEVLVRWFDRQSGFRSPGDFIPVLEKSGLIYQLDYYVWKLAVHKLNEWRKNGFEDMYISVNISMRDFYYGNLYEYFTGLVERYDVPPSSLHLEITESFFMEDKNLHREIIHNLQEYGFRIEMDDFGSGYSSLNALKDIRMDVLKIDMAFLRQSDTNERARGIISCIVKMAKALGMTVIAEGVETEKQAEFLKSFEVDVFQGYLYSEPVPVKDFEKKYLNKE